MSQLEALGALEALEAAPMTLSALLTALRLVREETFTVGHLPAIIRLQLHQDVSINWRKLFRKSPFWQVATAVLLTFLPPDACPPSPATPPLPCLAQLLVNLLTRRCIFD